MDKHDPAEPAKAGLAAQLVTQPEHENALGLIVRHERGLRDQPLNQIELFIPGGARPFLIPDGDGRAALTGPVLQGGIVPGCFADERKRQVLHMTHAFEPLGPRVGAARRGDDP